jgi:hypothetical protein
MTQEFAGAQSAVEIVRDGVGGTAASSVQGTVPSLSS